MKLIALLAALSLAACASSPSKVNSPTAVGGAGPGDNSIQPKVQK